MTDVVSVDIGSNSIKVLVGNKIKITSFSKIKTPEGSFSEGKIVNIDEIYEVLKEYNRENAIKAKDISFAIHGEDVIVRHLELPIMASKNLKQAVILEISQYLPEGGDLHYIDYEIIEKVNTKDKKVYRVLVAAVPKEKVDSYVELSKKLIMNLKAIDITYNCVARVFKDLFKRSRNLRSIGVIDLGSKSTSISIIDNGKLYLEREIPFGITNVVDEISNKFQMDTKRAHDYFATNFSFKNMDTTNEFHMKIKELFDDLFRNFERVIHFYSSRENVGGLDRIYIIGAGCEIYGLDQYMNDYFSTRTYLVRTPGDITSKVSFPNACDFKFYVNAFGLVLRKE